MSLASLESGRSKELSAGIITARGQSCSRDYLILKHENGGHWSFPKGHLETGETPQEAAVRELREETGLTVQEIFSDFNLKTSYTFERGGREIFKTVIYFLGIVSRASVILSSEHTNYQWLPYRKCRGELTYENDKKLLDRANKKFRGEGENE